MVNGELGSAIAPEPPPHKNNIASTAKDLLDKAIATPPIFSDFDKSVIIAPANAFPCHCGSKDMKLIPTSPTFSIFCSTIYNSLYLWNA
jgi:hypothetical protein